MADSFKNLCEKEVINDISRMLIELFPICRSLTGEGNRKTLKILSTLSPLHIQEIPTGTICYDWTIPKEWNIRDGWIKNSSGEKILDFKKSNLHVCGYSIPIHGFFKFEELKKHLFYKEDDPDAIPYRTSYYQENWGFCLTYQQYQNLNSQDVYEVFIDSELKNGSLTFADSVHVGKSKKEIMISTYCCHPSMGNDNLSGLILAILFFRYICQHETFYTYRLLIIPETIGVMAYFHQYPACPSQIYGGIVCSTVAGPGPLGLKSSFVGHHEIDQLAKLVLDRYHIDKKDSWIFYPFVPDGSDERQFSSPGWRIPTISMTKDKYYEYSEYHTSKDDLNFVKPEFLLESLYVHIEWWKSLEMNRIFDRTMPYGEYQLGKRNLYPQLGGQMGPSEKESKKKSLLQDASLFDIKKQVEALSWLMHGCDGYNDLLSLSKKSSISLEQLYHMAVTMQAHDLLTIKG
jgi:aminopeptidase-like protein